MCRNRKWVSELDNLKNQQILSKLRITKFSIDRLLKSLYKKEVEKIAQTRGKKFPNRFLSLSKQRNG